MRKTFFYSFFFFCLSCGYINKYITKIIKQLTFPYENFVVVYLCFFFGSMREILNGTENERKV